MLAFRSWHISGLFKVWREIFIILRRSVFSNVAFFRLSFYSVNTLGNEMLQTVMLSVFLPFPRGPVPLHL